MSTMLPVVGQVIEALRAEFCDPEHAPRGGAVPNIEHRPGADVALDGLFQPGCPGIVWANVIRIARSTTFPTEDETGTPCRGPRTVTIQVGAARCAATVDDHGYPPTPEQMEADALIGLDDAERLERALCRAWRAIDDLDLGHQATWSASDPIGPQGGVLAWTKTITIQLTR